MRALAFLARLLHQWSVTRAFQGAASMGFATEERAGVFVQYVEHADGARAAEGVHWGGRSRSTGAIVGLALCVLWLPLAGAQAPTPDAPAPADTTGPTPAYDLGRISRENYDNPLVQIDTSMGSMILELFPREAPRTVENFIGLAEGTRPFIDPATGEEVTRPFYDGLVFHRVIDGFMIQGGSPTGGGDGGPGYTIRDEINARSLGLDKMQVVQADGTPHPTLGIRDQADFQQEVLRPLYEEMGIISRSALESRLDEVYDRVRGMTVKDAFENQGYRYIESVISRAPVRGVIAMANRGPDTNGSQFFINLVDTPWLTGKHTVFGKVRAGMDVLDAIGAVPVDGDKRPLQDVEILSIRRLEE